ncbi:MAG: hypothetical protein ABI880_12185 [Acidobacteriota bacterium]
MQTPSSSTTTLPLSLAAVSDRRAQPRLSAEILGLEVDARLSLGVHVRVLNVSSGGSLLELHEWIRPGTKSELRLSKPTPGHDVERLSAQGQIARCWVHRLSPLRYRAALVFSALAPVTPDDVAAGEDLTVLLERPA